MPITIVEQHYQMVQHLDNEMKLELIAKLQHDIQQKQNTKPLNDLSKFKPRHDLVIGNSDDFVNINWEKEFNLDFPK